MRLRKVGGSRSSAELRLGKTEDSRRFGFSKTLMDFSGSGGPETSLTAVSPGISIPPTVDMAQGSVREMSDGERKNLQPI